MKNYENSINLFELLKNALPHGSGINGSWSFEVLKNGKINAINFYHAMDEFGGYCDYYDFKAVLFINDSGVIELEKIQFIGLNNRSKPEFFGLKDYLFETINLSLTDY